MLTQSEDGFGKVRAWEASDRLAMLRAEAAIPIQLLPVHLLDGPAADLLALGKFPLAHSLRTFRPDVLPLLLGQAGPPAGKTALGRKNCPRSMPSPGSRPSGP